MAGQGRPTYILWWLLPAGALHHCGSTPRRGDPSNCGQRDPMGWCPCLREEETLVKHGHLCASTFWLRYFITVTRYTHAGRISLQTGCGSQSSTKMNVSGTESFDAEDPSSVLSVRLRWLPTACTCGSRRSDNLFWHFQIPPLMCMYTYNMHKYTFN